MVDELLAKYRASFREEHYGGMWRSFFDRYHRPLHDVFMRGSPDEAEAVLRNPMSSYLRWGYDGMVKGSVSRTTRDTALLRKLGTALGAVTVDNPEAKASIRLRFGLWRRRRSETADSLLERIQKLTGRIDFPNPYPGETGLITSRGVASFRAIHAIYQARLLSGRVVEIGGGLGRVAYYAKRLGITDYTLVDLPFTGIAQGHFLALVLGPHHGVRIMSPDEFFSSTDTYDVALNADSITELDRTTAERYAAALKKRAARIVSINHEINPFTARDLFGSGSRYPYWLRDGYVEEHFQS